jgi:hypothetical protein
MILGFLQNSDSLDLAIVANSREAFVFNIGALLSAQ